VKGVSVFVLAGGRSTRMGTDKALLPFGDGNLLQLALSKARAISNATCIVGSKDRYSAYGEAIDDVHSGRGPLGGIHAALCATANDLNLMLSVDMPLMSVEYMRWMVELAAPAKELAIVPEAGGQLQPLCAIYRRASRCVIEQALKMGDYKVGHIFPLLPTRYVSEAEMLAAGFSADIFCNLNTPLEYESVRGDHAGDTMKISEGDGHE
jgi:molybdenum cofactor guanylyltransferase